MSTTPTMTAIRPPVCGTCWNVHRSTKPRPAVLYCHHRKVAAVQTGDGWRVMENVDRADADFLRHTLSTTPKKETGRA